jgi:hypothetical protein
MSDNHFVWRTVGNNFAANKEHAPQGFEPRVFVHMGGEAIPVTGVETHRLHPWALLYANTEGLDDPERAYASDRYVVANVAHIERIEIVFERIGKQSIGFDVIEAEDEPPEPMVA